MPVTSIKSDWTSGSLRFQETVAGNGAQVIFGTDDTGLDVLFYGDTSGAYMLWDESADNLVFTGGAGIDLDGADFALGDADSLVLGDSSDATLQWDGTNLLLSAAADDSVFEIGDSAATQKSWDVKIYGDAASGADFLLWDASASALELGGDARLDLSSGTVAAANTDGGIIKCGTSAARVTEDTANMKFLAFYFDNGATSGDNRGMYLRLYLTGAAGGGEACRIFTDVEDVAGGTAHGAHISIKFGTTGSITGLGVASRNTIHVPNSALTAGTYAATQPEIWSDGASSDMSGTTEYSFIRCVNGGNATGVGVVDDNAFLLTISGGAVGAGNLMAAKTASAVSHGIRMKGPDGNTYYIMVSDTQ